MFHERSGIPAAVLRSSLGALILAAGLIPAGYAGEEFYFPPPQTAGFTIPPLSAPAEAERGSSRGYLSHEQLQISDFPAPPAAGSAEDAADMAAVLQWQKDRTEAQCGAALAQSDASFISFFGGVSPFQKPLPARAGEFFKRVGKDAGEANRHIKNIYRRKRPFHRSSEVNPCLGRVLGFSYPSGHSSMSHLFGLILSDLLPREGAVFMREADQGALNRVIGGVHHPSDIEAGKELGDLLYKELRRNPAFVSDMEALAGYLRN